MTQKPFLFALIPCALAALFLSACPDGDCAIGSEGCACTAGGACDDGLSCLSNLCVNAGGGDGDGDTSLPVGDGDGDGSGSSGQIPACVAACETPNDCAVDISGGSAAHFLCIEGACVYRGCLSDDDCADLSLNGLDPRCAYAGIKVDAPELCVQGCSTPSDCVTDTYPDADADNWSCSQGACVYLGCRNDTECEGWVCRRRPYDLVDLCIPPCVNASDCAQYGDGSPDVDADNFACVNGGCVHQGCNDDSECGEGVCHVRWP